MWKTVAASVCGTSHVANNTPCQDASGHREIEIAGERVTLIALSDGAGTAKCADEGARFVVDQWLESAETILEEHESHDESTLVAIADFVRENLIDYVKGKEGTLRDYNCTLLGAVVFGTKGLFFQVGDGAWVFRKGVEYGCATWPSHGEYAGDANFLTASDAPAHYQTKVVEGINALAGFTDGLERLVLKMATKEASPAFFDGMFKSIEAREADEACKDLAIFLGSERVNERTDDDKTLVLAIKTTALDDRQ